MLQNLLDSWSGPATRHAMMVHFPIALSALGVPVALLAALSRKQPNPMRWLALALYALLSLAALAAKLSGEAAEEAIEGSLPETARPVLEHHEERAEWVWIFGSGVAVLLAGSLAGRGVLRPVCSWLAMAGGLFVAVWLADTAEHGGRLVYHHGAGTEASAVVVTGDGGSAAAASDPRLEHFRNRVRPILVDNCLRCHNPTRMRRAGELDLTKIAGALAGGMSGPALVPGRPDESLLLVAVRHEDPDLQMPRNKEKLPQPQIDALERWVADGAVWEPFEYRLATAAAVGDDEAGALEPDEDEPVEDEPGIEEPDGG
jgi:uncharacterized membrane protein